ncbi:HNH endonuclease, partial [bacterium]|nr:HNH endonuclease [bacterium]
MEATTADHIIPISKGGTDQLENLLAACIKC